MKRLLCTILALALCLALAAPAMAEKINNDEYVELEWYCRLDPVKPGVDDVMEVFNQYLMDQGLNCKVNAHFFPAADYTQKMSTMVSAGQELDFLHLGGVFPFVQNAQDGVLAPIEELLPVYAADTFAMLPQGLWDAVTVNGHIYGIPSYKDNSRIYNFVYNKTMADDLGIDPQEWTWGSYNDLIPHLYETRALRDAKYPDDASIPFLGATQIYMEAYYPYDVINGLAVANIPDIEAFAGKGAGEMVFNLYETDEYRAWAKTHRQLVEDGMITDDPENFDPDNVLRDSGKLFHMWNAGLVTIDPHQYGDAFEVGMTNSTNVAMYNSTIQAAVQGVSSTSKYPERVLQVLNLINTDHFAATTLRFGIEGVHYSHNDDGFVTFENAKKGPDDYYYWYGWQFGCTFTIDLPETQPADLWDLIRHSNEVANQKSNLGFCFDTANVTNEIAACTSVISEYETVLNRGVVEDVDALVDEFIAKLQASGSQRIVDEAQAQLTAWRASVGRTTL